MAKPKDLRNALANQSINPSRSTPGSALPKSDLAALMQAAAKDRQQGKTADGAAHAKNPLTSAIPSKQAGPGAGGQNVKGASKSTTKKGMR